MKIIKNSVLGILMVLLLSSTALLKQSSTSKKKTVPAETNKGFALLELFTSEGCSSCPRADDLMARIQKESGDKPVYILSYHVDYWNRLGWKDIFSSAQFTERQYLYHRWFSQVYTPQLIINGSAEFVGGDAAGISKEVQKVMNRDASTTLSLQMKPQLESTELHYQISGNMNKEQLLIAVVQKHAVNKVKRGENEGRTLSHVQIVRQFYSFALTPTKKGTVKITLPTDFNTAEWEIIGMLQDPNTGVISAATRATTPSTTASWEHIVN